MKIGKGGFTFESIEINEQTLQDLANNGYCKFELESDNDINLLCDILEKKAIPKI